MPGRAEPGAQSDARAGLVRLGHLCFDDLLLLKPETLDAGHWTSDLIADWALATNNAPTVQLHFRRSANLQSAIRNLQSPAALADIRAAQSRLVHAFAYDLLRAKAPPLYDALPWHDWDFWIVARRFKLWQTRFLLAGDGTTVTMCRCRKSAGAYVFEPDETIGRYTEAKAALEKVRRFRLVSPKPQATSPRPLEIPLPDSSVDLAIVGSSPHLQAANCEPVTRELTRVAINVLLVENNPLCQPLDEGPLTAAGFIPDSVEVRGFGARRCWWERR
ncbi:hypothetical protein FJY68_00935 [candidate division WOR-3 bacterium]|uniref:Uncharacterized protein n=1 Tax=candidate division WOR-3 bacterium TaxID=2052148 RepID=A0A937XEW1_UNCW3|nr:hypothetical protein [candidate division WOR-3 bacterium]